MTNFRPHGVSERSVLIIHVTDPDAPHGGIGARLLFTSVLKAVCSKMYQHCRQYSMATVCRPSRRSSTTKRHERRFSRCQSSEQLQPIRTSEIIFHWREGSEEWVPCLVSKKKHCTRQQVTSFDETYKRIQTRQQLVLMKRIQTGQ